MSKIIRTQKPSVLPFYAMALVFLGLCAVLPVYKLWALLAALGGALIAFGAAQKVCPPRVVEHEVPFHTGEEGAQVCKLLPAGCGERAAAVCKAGKAGRARRECRSHPYRGGAQCCFHCHGV